MFKIIFISIFTILIQIIAPTNALSKSFYAGLTTSYDFGRVKINATETVDGEPLQKISTLSLESFGVGVILGHQLRFGDSFFGLEAISEIESGDSKQISVASNGLIGGRNLSQTTIKKRFSNELSVKIGHLVFDKAMLYAKGGIVFNNYAIKISNSGLQNNHVSLNKSFPGAVFSVGTEIEAIKCVTFRFEASHQRNSSKKIRFFNGLNDNNKLNFSPKCNKITAGMVLYIL